MATRYRRDKQNLQIEGQTIQWPQDTDEINRIYKSKVRQYNGLVWPLICNFSLSRRYFVAIVLSHLRFVASVHLVGILWSLYCLTSEVKLLLISSVSCGFCIVWPSICSFCYRRSDNTMATRYWRDKQKQQVEGQTIQWPQDTDEINRSYKSKVR
jgi:hypothetical protein